LATGGGGAGGGGRIALEWGTNAFLGLLSAVGGGSDSGWGGAGTIFTKANARLSGQVLADNGGHPGTNTSLSPAASPFDLIVSGGAVVSPPSSALTLHSVRIADGGSICAPRSNFPLDLVVLADAAIETGGAIAVDGQGYLPGAGPGAGMSSGGVGSGAGYGGVGGASSTSPGGVSYGSVMQPSSFGSGGGLGVANSQNSVTGSTGGGALRLAIAGTLTVNGMIGAAGASGVGEAYGGGSGGSIWVNAGVVAGSGWIAADGGDGYPGLGGGGAGGRVAVYSPANLFQGDVSVHGGSGYAAGQDGSYYRSAVAPQVMAQAVAVDGKNVVLNWLGVAFVNYQVYYSTNLMDWQYYSGAGLGTNGPMQTLIYNDGQAAKFFRVQAGN